jgi:hypothetical protein
MVALLPNTPILRSDLVTRQLTTPGPNCIADANAVLAVGGAWSRLHGAAARVACVPPEIPVIPAW